MEMADIERRDAMTWQWTTAFTLMALTLAGGQACSPTWTVLQQSGPPSALRGLTSLGVAFDASALVPDNPHIDDTTTHTTGNSDAHRLVTRMNHDFLEALQIRLPTIEVVLMQAIPTQQRPLLTLRYVEMDVGAYSFLSARDARVHAEISVSIEGETVDAIASTATTHPTIYTPSAAERLRLCAEHLARQVARYINQAQR